MPNPNTTFVLAGTYREFQNYARAKALYRDVFDFLENARLLLSIHEPRIIRIGTWWKRSDLPQIEAAIQARKATVTDDVFEGSQ